jgi:hypothetical protein
MRAKHGVGAGVEESLCGTLFAAMLSFGIVRRYPVYTILIGKTLNLRFGD